MKELSQSEALLLRVFTASTRISHSGGTPRQGTQFVRSSLAGSDSRSGLDHSISALKLERQQIGFRVLKRACHREGNCLCVSGVVIRGL